VTTQSLMRSRLGSNSQLKIHNRLKSVAQVVVATSNEGFPVRKKILGGLDQTKDVVLSVNIKSS